MYIAADHVKLRFSYDASGNVVAVDYSEDDGTNYTTYYYLRNAQNDIVKLIDSTGTTVVEYVYNSWGSIVSTTGTLANTVGTYQPFRYRGYVYDTESQWYYLQSRYYDPATCRFISADVLLSTGQGVIGHNSFAYCLNNPICRSDSAGNYSEVLLGRERRLDGQGTGSFGIGGYGGGAGLLTITSLINSFDIEAALSLLEGVANAAIIGLLTHLIATVAEIANKSIGQTPRNDHDERHHVIPIGSSNTSLSRFIYMDLCRGDIDGLENTIYLNPAFHARLHTIQYYATIESLIVVSYALGKDAMVHSVILVVKAILSAYNALI
ncbi:MAG: RHS repeat-associated core domain-containing protein [Clostridiales bacterium]|nr:RHS repeat-associated core domain-containing protein [Clostridiales bacterium]